MEKVNSILDYLLNKRIVIYGTGYVAKKFYNALIIQGLDKSVEFFVVSNKEESVSHINGIRVESISEFRNRGEVIICLAVHDTLRLEIETLLIKKGIRNYIWIAPVFLAQLVYGRPVLQGIMVNVNEIIRKCNDYRFAVKYLAIENYFGINNFGYDIYIKAQQLYCGRKTAEKRLRAFCNLINSWEQFGYRSGVDILLDDKYGVLDGAHRVTLASYFGVEDVKCDVFETTSCSFDWHGDGVSLTTNKMIEGNFTSQELIAVEKAYARIQKDDKC